MGLERSQLRHSGCSCPSIMKNLLLALSPLIASCALNAEPELELDMDSDPALAVTAVISIHADAPPDLVAFREGTGAWRRATQVRPTEYTATVRGPYSVLGACAGSIQVSSRTLRDAPSVDLYCSPPAEPDVTAAGTMVQPGTVTLGLYGSSSSTANWSYSLQVPAGDYDQVAFTADRLTLRKNLSLRTNTTLPPLDLANATPFATATFTPTNSFPGETQSVSTFLVGPRLDPQARIYRGSLSNAKVAPSSLLAGDVTQEVSLRSELFVGTRYLLRSTRYPFKVGGATSFTYWDPMAGVTFGISNGRPMVSWTSRADMDYLYYSAYGANGASYTMDVTRHYLNSLRSKRLVFDVDTAPGFRPEWKLPVEFEHSVSAQAQLGTTSRVGYLLSDVINPGVLPASRVAAPERPSPRAALPL